MVAYPDPMPVLVTGVEDALGRRAAERLLRAGGEVRVWLDEERSGDDDALAWRAYGAKAAIGAADDEGRLEAALEQVHTVVHLAGSPLEDPDAGTEHLATVVSAALGAGCRRLVWVSDLALSAVDEIDEPGAYVAALADQVALIGDLPLDVVELRTGLRYGPEDSLTAFLAAHADGLRSAAAPHAPVWIDDVAAAVVAADAQRGSAPVRVLFSLVGPDVVPLGRLAQGLAEALAADRAADDGAPTGDERFATLHDWLRIPADGDADALAQGRSFAEGLAALRAARGAAGA